ncbi:MAG: preprotein translocase subunit SecA [Streptococcaceae bacterium]|jgi:preprotein translocase subunit SecA|nr:preprotein translocase subunit SecA [Streptococcaceae bacterium]
MKSPTLWYMDYLARKIEKQAPTFQKLSDTDLQAKTKVFRERIQRGKPTSTMLTEIFATIIEADARVLGMRPYHVQILGALALYFGNVAEMHTGEGKTLTATMALYARGLEGNGNFLITSNSYLAWRDAEEIGKVYQWLGLTLEVGVEKEASDEELDKKRIYAADIVYTTHAALGFDYIFDNLATTTREQFLPDFRFALIDEIDAILLDSALTALIVAGAPKLQSNLFENSDWFVKSLEKESDYKLSKNQKKVWFTTRGLQKADYFFGLENILSEDWTDLYRHFVLALKANTLFHKDRDYIVADGEVILLDETNGRELQGMKLQAGLHQAIEAKERVKITGETKSLGTVTYQNLFRKFRILSGMTGTAKTDQDEFLETYNLKVLSIPTHLPSKRKDHKDLVYPHTRDKMTASLQKVKEAVQEERPVLIETGSVGMSRLYSLMLLKEKIPHHLLNATSATREREIVAAAGRKGAVTVATVMVGRGTDVKLDADSKEKGLLVLGTERMSSPRIDNQLRGRAGRQGEPGESQFFVSLEDKIVAESAPERVRRHIYKLSQNTTSGTLTGPRYSRIIHTAQKRRKTEEVESRKEVLKYDSLIATQREKVYASRQAVMTGNDAYLKHILDKSVTKSLTQLFNSEKQQLTEEDVLQFLYHHVDPYFEKHQITGFAGNSLRENALLKHLKVLITELISKRLASFGSPEQTTHFLRLIILKALDVMWVEELDNLEQWKMVVGRRILGGHQPIYEFQKEAQKSFVQMKKEVWSLILKNFLLSQRIQNEDGTIDIIFP